MIIMLSLNNVKATSGSRKSSRRIGRGNGSNWTYCGRGMNGQNCRSGGWVPDWFEGWQTPLFRRLPKLKGFSNSKFKKHFNLINLSDLEVLASKNISEVNFEVLLENGLIAKKNLAVKLLWNGELTKKINVIVDNASASAKEAVEKAWGKIELK